MKHSLCFFAGAALVSAAVVYAGGKPAGMFIAGGLAAVVFVLCGSRIAGFARVGRFFLAVDRFQHAGFAAPAAPTPRGMRS